MSRPRIGVASALLAALLGGCLPPGDPPPGNVTVNPDTPAVTAAAARERMITELTTALLLEAPGAEVRLETDAATRAAMLRVWPECAKLTGSRTVANAEWTVRSTGAGGRWQVELRRKDTVVRSIVLPRF